MSSQKRKVPYLLLLFSVLLTTLLLLYKTDRRENDNTLRRYDTQEPDFRNRKPYYTKHAICRMECRSIDETEVLEILREGTINYNKSDLSASPCPSYAVEGMTHDRQKVRVVVADCSSQPGIITVIDLGKDDDCQCD